MSNEHDWHYRLIIPDECTIFCSLVAPEEVIMSLQRYLWSQFTCMPFMKTAVLLSFSLPLVLICGQRGPECIAFEVQMMHRIFVEIKSRKSFFLFSNNWSFLAKLFNFNLFDSGNWCRWTNLIFFFGFFVEVSNWRLNTLRNIRADLREFFRGFSKSGLDVIPNRI